MDSSTHANPSAAPADASALEPDALTPAVPEVAADDSLDAILRQIVGGYFVLTDGQGSVSKWSEPAELLFGQPSADVLGNPFFETLVQGPLPAAAEAWRGFLETGEPPQTTGRVEVTGLHADGTTFPMETVFVPVKLDEGFDFSLFLEDLGFELPLNLMLQRMRAQHPVVVRALRQALDAEPQPWEGWRTAGTLVVFHPLQPTPWVEEALAAREAARAEADAEVEERLTALDPGIQGSSVADLDDAAAVVARLLSAMERIDELERIAIGLPGQLEEARQQAERRAEAAEREAQALRAEVQRALAEPAPAAGVDEAAHHELLARLERLERARMDAEQATADRARALDAAESARAELAARLDRLERQRAESSSAADARLATAVAEAQRRADEAIAEAGRRADEARAEVEARLAEIERTRSDAGEVRQAELEQVRAEHEEAVQAARNELAEAIERSERERAREAEAARAELAAALQRVETVQREADSLREQLAAVAVERHEADGLAGEDRRRLDDLARDAEAARARIETFHSELDALRSGADDVAVLRERVEALDEVRARLDGLEAGAGEVDALRAELAAVRENLAAVERTAAQVDELRRSLEEPMLPASHAVERDEVDALRSAEQALRMRLAELTTRVDEAQAAVAGRFDELEAARREESDAVNRRVDEARDELSERIAQVDRGAGDVLGEVSALRERLDEVADGAAGDRAGAEELRGAVARFGGELEVARSQVEHARQEALGAREQAAAAGEAAAAAREDAGHTREEAGALRREVEGGAERLNALAAEVERATGAAAVAATAAEEAHAEAAAAHGAGERAAERLTELDSRANELRAEMTAGRERLDALTGRMERLGTDVVEAGQSAGAARAAVEAQATELREELAAVRRIAEEAVSGVDAMRADVTAVREQSQALRDDAASARVAAEGGERRVEAMQAELTFALKSLEDLKAGLTSAGQAAVIARREAEQAKRAAQNVEGSSGVHEVFAQLIAAARGGGGAAGRRPLNPGSEVRRREAARKREPRHGFDDVPQPQAILSVDGHFRELNPSFARLVGYQEHEFAKATWPSPHDRALYQQQQEQLRQLASGEIESVSVQSTYMHGQGLMVPVVGIIRVVPGEDGLPLHLLLEAEERHTG